jgi:hypothetical protein
VKVITDAQAGRVVGGSCYSEQMGMCAEETDPLCGDKQCECKVMTKDEGSWGQWSAWDTSNCNRYEFDAKVDSGYIEDYVIEGRCPSGTTAWIDESLDYTECVMDAENGGFNHLIQEGETHYCYKIRTCNADHDTCSLQADHTSRCAEGAGSGDNPPEGSPNIKKLDKCDNTGSDVCPPGPGS